MTVRSFRVAVGATILVGAMSVGADARERADSVAAPPDLGKLISCRASIKEWGAFAFDFAGVPGRAAAWGWKKAVKQPGLVETYELPSPVTVFGHKSSRIAFSGTGITAVLTTPIRPLAAKLGLKPVVQGGSTLIFGKTIHEKSDPSFSEKISLTAGTSEAFPGQTLAGCSYAVEVR